MPYILIVLALLIPHPLSTLVTYLTQSLYINIAQNPKFPQPEDNFEAEQYIPRGGSPVLPVCMYIYYHSQYMLASAKCNAARRSSLISC